MTKQVKLKCLHCGYEYAPGPSENPEIEERVCPRCHSNSVRLIWVDDASQNDRSA